MTLIADKIIAAANRRHQFQSTKSGKRRLLTLKDLDSRTRATRQALALRDGFLSDWAVESAHRWRSRSLRSGEPSLGP